MADGGEGTVQALVDATGGGIRTATVTGPLGEPVEAFYGVLGDGRTAVIEMAAASGLPLVPPTRRDPSIATTRGTGELILRAVEDGARKLLIGIGGSATNDAGAGMARALGFRLVDEAGADLPPGGAALARLDRILPPPAAMRERLTGAEITVACDVTNPLCGPQGASCVFGPQKGATPAMVEQLDAALARFAEVAARGLGADVLKLPGGGAAGGLGAGLVAFLGARLTPGVEMVVEATGLDALLEGADLCITGEGRLDAQTPHGKTPSGVARVCAAHGVPCVAVGGTVDRAAREELECLFAAVVSTVDELAPLPSLLANARHSLAASARTVARLMQVAPKDGAVSCGSPSHLAAGEARGGGG